MLALVVRQLNANLSREVTEEEEVVCGTHPCSKPDRQMSLHSQTEAELEARLADVVTLVDREAELDTVSGGPYSS